jgi:hypothetical protein
LTAGNPSVFGAGQLIVYSPDIGAGSSSASSSPSF